MSSERVPTGTLSLMKAAARAAGHRLRTDFAAVELLTVQAKAGADDLFTEADVRAEQTVREILCRDHPTFAFLGEESGLSGDGPYCWVVDPLDGTMNFLTGLPIWAVNIALTHHGEVIAGVTYVPMLDEIFEAEVGGGAFLNGRPIRISSRPTLLQSVLAVGIPFASKPRHDQFHAEMARLTPRVSGIRRLGAGAIDMVYVACGRFDAYWEQSVSAWDMAAGAVIVREAGGWVGNTAGGTLDIHGGTVLACTPQLRDEVLAALAPV